MGSSVSKKWSKAGTLPGQKIELSVAYVSRTATSITFSYKFSAKSLGNDQFKYNERHNKSILEIGYKSTSWTYQLRGTGASRNISDTITLYTSDTDSTLTPDTTEFDIYFTNKRIWAKHTHASNPRTTGVISRTKLGTISFAQMSKGTINFKPGQVQGSITNIPPSITAYTGTSLIQPGTQIVSDSIPLSDSIIPAGSQALDLSNRYVALDNYSELTILNSDYVNEYSDERLDILHYYPAAMPEGTTDYNIVWKPQTFTYNFLINKDLIDTATYTYKQEQVVRAPVIDLNTYQGYQLDKWSYKTSTYAPNDVIALIDKTTTILNFAGNLSPLSGYITFNIGDTERKIPYIYNSKFNFRDVFLSGESATNIRPGYKLVGWTYVESSKPYLPGEGAPRFNLYGKEVVNYPGNNFSNTDFITRGIQLYPVWEYYSATSICVTTNNIKQLRLAIPYVLKNKKWHASLPYLNIKKDNQKHWKL